MIQKGLFILVLIVGVLFLTSCSLFTEPKVNETLPPQEILTPEVEVPQDIIPPLVTHTVLINQKGFEPRNITIKVGEQILFVNERSGRLNKALVQGTQNCVEIESPILQTNQTFSWIFDKAVKCQFVDAITKQYVMKVVVEE